MEENKTHTPRPGPGFETSDINVWAVGKFAIALVAIMVVSLALLFGLMKYFQSQEAHEKATTVDPPKVFNEGVLLQDKPVVDLKKFHDSEDKVLNSYAWVDQSKGIVRIPIDRAIDIVAQRGLPAASVPQASAPATREKNK